MNIAASHENTIFDSTKLNFLNFIRKILAQTRG